MANRQTSIAQALSLAVQCHNRGDLSRAESIYNQILQQDGRQPDALHLSGVIALQGGKVELAVELIRKALAARPNFAEAHSNLGIALKRMERFEEAVESYRSAIVIKPNYPAAHNNLGLALQELGRVREAVECFRKALSIQPANAEAYNNLGNALADLSETAESETSFQKAIAIKPDYAEAHANLGRLYESTNRLADAETHLQRALALNPEDHGTVILRSVLLRRRGRNAEAIENLEQLPFDMLRGVHRSKAYFELGKLYDRELDCDRAFDCFANGNEAQAAHRANTSDANKYLAAIDGMSRFVTRENVAAWHSEFVTSTEGFPVFLVGFPRSGTTLLDQILDGHPRLQTMEEQPILDSIASGIDSLAGGYPAALPSINESVFHNLRQQYERVVAERVSRRAGTTLVDKFPLNIRHVPLIARLFPGAKIVMALRHPADAVLSNFMQLYKLNDAMANFHTLNGAATLYQRVMSLWQQCVEVLPLNVLEVKYEDVVSDLEQESRRLIEFLGVGWDEAVLEFHTHARQRERIRTPSYEQVSEPIYQRAKYRWKRYEKQLAPVLPQLEPFIQAFGYA